MGLTLNDNDMIASNNINTLTYYDLYQRLKAIALVMFKWENLPDPIPAQFIEKTLYEYGVAGFINDKTLGHMVTKLAVAGKLNHYDQPVRYRAWAIEYNKAYDRDDLVVIKNNYQERPTSQTIKLYAQRLYEVERSTDVNIKLQKFPLVIRGPKSQLMSLKNIFMKYDGNQPAIYADAMLDENAIKAIKTDVPYIADKLIQYKHELWNECLTFLGINNLNGDKKERLIVDEANANGQLIELSADVMLSARLEAAEQINKLFGLDVKVSLRRQPGQEPQPMLPDWPGPDQGDQGGEIPNG